MPCPMLTPLPWLTLTRMLTLCTTGMGEDIKEDMEEDMEGDMEATVRLALDGIAKGRWLPLRLPEQRSSH